MAIVWTQKLATGVTRIDDEHRELFDRVNRLLDAMQAARGREEIAPLVGFLSDYVKVHFGGEERLMDAHRYPQATAHRQQHAYFVGQFKEMVGEIERTGPTALLTIKLNKLLCDWLREHVASTDKAFGGFLQTAGVAADA